MDGWTIAEGFFLILLGIVIALKLSRPTVINNYAPKAEAYADSGGSGSSGSAVGALVKVSMLGVVLMIALAVVSAITNIATGATDAISEVARPVIVQESVPVEAPVPVPAPAHVPGAQPGLGDLFADFLSAGGWIPFALIVALILTRPRGKRVNERPTTVYYPPHHEDVRGIPVEDVPLFAGNRESREK